MVLGQTRSRHPADWGHRCCSKALQGMMDYERACETMKELEKLNKWGREFRSLGEGGGLQRGGKKKSVQWDSNCESQLLQKG